MKKITPLLLLLLISLPAFPSFAKDAPTVGEMRKKYEEASKNFTEEQQQIIKELDEQRLEATGYEVGIIMSESTMQACEKNRPGFIDAYRDAFEKYKYHQQTLMKAARKELSAKVRQLDFVNPDYVAGSFVFSDKMMKELTTQIAKIPQEAGVKPELCEKFENEMLQYADGHKQGHSSSQTQDIAGAGFAQNKNLTNGKIEYCRVSWGMTDTQGRRATGTFAYDLLDSPEPKLSFSMKVTDPTTLKSEGLEYGFINFDGFNTRDHAEVVLSKQLFMGHLKPEHILDILKSLKKNAVFSHTVHVSGESAPFSFKAGLPEKDTDKLAECIYNLNTAYKEPLEQMGFSNLTLDEEHQNAKNMPPVKYKTTSQAHPNGEPAMCIWMMDITATKNPYSATLLVAGELSENHPINNQTQLWIIGMNHATGKRYNIAEGWIEVAKADNPDSIIDIRDIQTYIAAGERYTLVLPKEALPELLAGIDKNGLTLKARAKDTEEVTSLKIDPPNPNETATFQKCLENIPSSE